MYEEMMKQRREDRRLRQLKAMPFCHDCMRRDRKHNLAVNLVKDGKGETISVCADCYAERTGG